MERTYVMIKPDGVQRGLIGEIIGRIERRGLKISAMRMNVIDENDAKEHYSEHCEKPFFGSLISYVISAPSVSMIVEGKDAIKSMRTINGATNPSEAMPGTIRGDFALETGRNVVHASDSVESAEREISIHFKDDETNEYSRIDEEWLYE
ncbi:nucleoside-diphosphate kinase [Methanohalophilus portucalensis]|uniref:Nucleoside diphosphate kinase n=2 Tax=Methanohalophilus portucalensis TaxID=39664 RepID=A0A1L9C7C2_9EURY|nr:nucleoside-diphosphate kinase [Methanohalophilus portucalensis]ATU08915.1 nucleoside-diphosphate kinase [Methanohalophilus portucalensis]OJH50321.1 nucleoside diphosphate kinase [Methanohalophilus portucalensis FDF-1]RNI11240.1 nucleoside-diphosphate kinase [Methanohalophilus portucalensis FDF-1]SMH28959.1 nucleoside diphosphate kinase [Methanohalophilus portucalensis FDF-1]